jgi:hypothetical protein
MNLTRQEYMTVGPAEAMYVSTQKVHPVAFESAGECLHVIMKHSYWVVLQ